MGLSHKMYQLSVALYRPLQNLVTLLKQNWLTISHDCMGRQGGSSPALPWVVSCHLLEGRLKCPRGQSVGLLSAGSPQVPGGLSFFSRLDWLPYLHGSGQYSKSCKASWGLDTWTRTSLLTHSIKGSHKEQEKNTSGWEKQQSHITKRHSCWDRRNLRPLTNYYVRCTRKVRRWRKEFCILLFSGMMVQRKASQFSPA